MCPALFSVTFFCLVRHDEYEGLKKCVTSNDRIAIRPQTEMYLCHSGFDFSSKPSYTEPTNSNALSKGPKRKLVRPNRTDDQVAGSHEKKTVRNKKEA